MAIHFVAGNSSGAFLVVLLQVAEVCIAALVEPSARNKVVEIIASKDAPERTFEELFSSV